MAIVFTCAKCDTRAVKAFSKQSYERGLVSPHDHCCTPLPAVYVCVGALTL